MLANVVIFLLSVQLCWCDDSPKISTPLGEIVGHYLVSANGSTYGAFEGIPYALPPTGNRRFRPPEPTGPWEGELVANKFPAHCMGHSRIEEPNGYVDGVEDCLYLNVYVPIRKNNDLLPVILYIHGGAFMESTLTGVEQRYMIDHDIIFVSVNYRLGALGFLSTEDDIVSGNMGLKDQSLALRWIHENIEYFGGDSDRITLFGLSAGGSSVHYHYLSPMSVGLFRAGISTSGTAYVPWAQTENSLEKAIRLGNILNCTMVDVRDVIECLRTKPAVDITEALIQFMPWKQNEFTPFGPVVENIEKGAFVNRSPAEIIESGDVYDAPWVTSVVSEEGLYPVAEFITNDTALKEVNDNWITIAPHLLQYYYTVPKSHHANVATKIREHYLGNKSIDSETRLNFTHLVTDRIFSYDAQKAAKAQAKINKSPVWFYYYSYRGEYSLSEVAFRAKGNLGVSHADDFLYATGSPKFNITKSKDDFAIHKALLNYIISFAYNGVPTLGSNWTKIEPEAPYLNYLHISGPGKYEMEKNDNFAQKNFWDTLDEINENKINRNCFSSYVNQVFKFF